MSGRLASSARSKKLIAGFLSLILLAGGWAQVGAQTPECVSRINGLMPNTTMLVIGRNGQRFAGRLVAVDAETRILQLTSETELGDYTREIPYDAIGEIRYTGAGRIQPMYSFWGLLLGAAAGFLIGQSIDSGKEAGDDAGGGATGAAIGAVGGAAIGAGISLFVPSQRKIDCTAKPETDGDRN